MLIEASYDYPKHIAYTADSTHTIEESDTITFRVGTPGPVGGSIETPLVVQALTRETSKKATGTVARSDLVFDPGHYAWHVEIARLGIVASGIFRLDKSIPRS